MKKEEMQTLTKVLTFILLFFISYSIDIYVYLETAEADCSIYEDHGSMGVKVPEEIKNYDKKITIDVGKNTEESTDKSGGTEKLSPKMIFIKSGCFQMGSPDDDGLNYDDKKPIHEVCLDDYYIGEHEVTRGQWKNLMGPDPSGLYKHCENFPIEDVSWNDVQLFIKKLNKGTGQIYRLPTEAEWEYAARERGQSQKYAGTSNESDLKEYAWFWTHSNYVPNPVKSKKPNSIGLYDMSGNLSEWVQDWYDGHYYSISPIHNPTGPNSGTERVMRGGDWGRVKLWLRTFHRNSGKPNLSLMSIGFRLAKSVKK